MTQKLRVQREAELQPMTRPQSSVPALLNGQSTALAQMQVAANARPDVHRLQALQDTANAQSKPDAPTQRESKSANTIAGPKPVAMPVGYAQDGISYGVMSTDDYQTWKGTAQFAGGIHGTATIGDRTIVTQYKSNAEVKQLFLPNWAKASLLMLEGALTMTAGIAAAVLTGGITIIPSILGAVVGALKFARGATMLLAKDSVGRTRVLDAMRGLEAIAAMTGAIMTGNPALIVFAAAKGLRSLLMAITNYMGEKTKHPGVRKGLMCLSAFAHAVEVVALGFASYGNISEGLSAGEDGLSSILGGSIIAGVGASKAVRAVDQANGARKAKVKSDDAVSVVDERSYLGESWSQPADDRHSLTAEPTLGEARERRGSEAGASGDQDFWEDEADLNVENYLGDFEEETEFEDAALDRKSSLKGEEHLAADTEEKTKSSLDSVDEEIKSLPDQ